MREGGGNCLKYLERGGTERRGEETKILKRGGGKLGQWVGALKRACVAGTSLRTMIFRGVMHYDNGE